MASNHPFSQVGSHKIAQTQSRFLSIPSEIRNDIYERVFDKMLIPHNGGSRSPTAKNLLLACKQTHAEAIKLFYNTTDFFFAADEWGRPLQDWINCIGPSRASLIKRIYLQSCPHLNLLSIAMLGNDYPYDTEEEERIRVNAAEAQLRLDRNQRKVDLPKGVLALELEIEEHLVWTTYPVKLASEVVAFSVYIPRQGRFWTSKPSKELKCRLNFIKTLEETDGLDAETITEVKGYIDEKLKRNVIR